ncbi:MAG: hypothetical protein ACR2RD_14655 [Woeseiaceae bacterium]
MMTELLKSLAATGHSIHDSIINAPPHVPVIVLLAIVVVALVVLYVYRNLARIVGAVVRIAIYRCSQGLGSLKTSLVCKLRNIFPHGTSAEIAEIPQVDFDDLDIAVLDAAATLSPGFTISAPELAERFRIRPAVVQRSLSKLCTNRMLEFVIGSTEGFDNYKLTQLGNAFMSTRQS